MVVEVLLVELLLLEVVVGLGVHRSALVVSVVSFGALELHPYSTARLLRCFC